jgi:hypothetical protein
MDFCAVRRIVPELPIWGATHFFAEMLYQPPTPEERAEQNPWFSRSQELPRSLTRLRNLDPSRRARDRCSAQKNSRKAVEFVESCLWNYSASKKIKKFLSN